MLQVITAILILRITSSQSIDVQYKDKLVGDDGAFGWSLGAARNRVLVGTLRVPLREPSVPATIVDRGLVNKIQPPLGVACFGVSVAINGNYILVSGIKVKNGSDDGQTFVFAYSAHRPHFLVAELFIDALVGFTDVAISNDNTIAVIMKDRESSIARFRVFEYDGEDQWSVLKTEVFEDITTPFVSVRIFGSEIALGLPYDHFQVQVYRKNHQTWNFFQRLQPASSSSNTFSYGLTMNKNRMAVAHWQDNQQRVLVYEKRELNGKWMEDGDILVSAQKQEEGFFEVALAKDFLIVALAAIGMPVVGVETKVVAKAFKKHKGSWREHVNLVADNQLNRSNFRVRTDEVFVFTTSVSDEGPGIPGVVYVHDLNEM